MPNLLIIRGAPGSGKSTIARKLTRVDISGVGYIDGINARNQPYDVYYEADMYFTIGNDYVWEPEEVHNAHLWCQSQVRKALIDGKNVIVSNTSCKESEANTYRELAKRYGATVQEMVLMEVPYKTVHSVPEEKVKEYHERLMESLADRSGREGT